MRDIGRGFFSRQQLRAHFRRAGDQCAHHRTRRLRIDGQSISAQHSRRRRTDGGDDHALKRFAKLLRFALAARDRERVFQLRRVGEQNDVDLAADNFQNQLAQRRGVFRKLRAINGDRRHLGAARFQFGEEHAVRFAVFLNGHAQTADVFFLVERFQNVAPSVRLGNADVRRQSELGQHFDGLGAAHDQRHFFQRRRDLFHRHMFRQGLDQRARADAGHENQHIDVRLARFFPKTGDVALVAERHFAHRRRDRRHAAEVFNQARHLGLHAALERGHAQTVECFFRVETGTLTP